MAIKIKLSDYDSVEDGIAEVLTGLLQALQDAGFDEDDARNLIRDKFEALDDGGVPPGWRDMHGDE